jgi:hypothetical protein
MRLFSSIQFFSQARKKKYKIGNKEVLSFEVSSQLRQDEEETASEHYMKHTQTNIISFEQSCTSSPDRAIHNITEFVSKKGQIWDRELFKMERGL